MVSKVPPYMFRDEQHKKDCLTQAMQLSRKMFASNPPRSTRDHTNALLYLGMIYLLQRTLARRTVSTNARTGKEAGRVVLESKNLRIYLKTEEKLRKAANRFFANPMKTALWLSGI